MFHLRKSNTDILSRVHFVKTSRSLEHDLDDKLVVSFKHVLIGIAHQDQRHHQIVSNSHLLQCLFATLQKWVSIAILLLCSKCHVEMPVLSYASDRWSQQ